MTTDLEKTFFDTFGFEPKTNREYGYKMAIYNQDRTEEIKFYPQITDRILLELICILLSNNSPYMFKLGDWDVEKLKDAVLTMCIKLPDFLEWENTSEYFKHQVRKLFKEEVR